MRRVDVRSRRRLLDDFFKVDEAEVSFERTDGSMTPPVRRLVFERGDSVAAVVLHRESRSLLLTEQFRFPTLGKGEGWLVEVRSPDGIESVPGLCDAAARRELARIVYSSKSKGATEIALAMARAEVEEAAGALKEAEFNAKSDIAIAEKAP